ncbi:hypothetical protein [uncultured Aquimarina sp.]|uniref:hypothetical protein n=1 Tax=uncultured Aquimarina sp. TaxID=575652 RepID=UPI0026066F0D|nr:hypothetical protein [uncultured Aquimarina sp.]
MNTKLLICIMVMICQHLCFSQKEKGFANREEIKEECQQIINDFSQKNIAAGLIKIGMMWVFTRDEYKYINQRTMDHFDTFEVEYGALIGNKLVKEDVIEDLIYMVTYVIKYERSGVIIKFTFYNGKNDKWYLNDFKWDKDLLRLFKESRKEFTEY